MGAASLVGSNLAVKTLILTDDLLVMAGDNVLDFSLSNFVNFTKEEAVPIFV